MRLSARAGWTAGMMGKAPLTHVLKTLRPRNRWDYSGFLNIAANQDAAQFR